MSDNQNIENKPDLNITILKAYAEKLQREVANRDGFEGTRLCIKGLSEDLSASNISMDRMREIYANLILMERQIRERLEKERSEKENEEPLRKFSKAMSGELEI